MAALTYFDLYADAYRRGVMTEGQLVSAVRLGRITLPQAYEIRDTGGKCGALWTPPAEPTPAPTPTPTPTPTPEPSTGAGGSSGTGTGAGTGESESGAQTGAQQPSEGEQPEPTTGG